VNGVSIRRWVCSTVGKHKCVCYIPRSTACADLSQGLLHFRPTNKPLSHNYHFIFYNNPVVQSRIQPESLRNCPCSVSYTTRQALPMDLPYTRTSNVSEKLSPWISSIPARYLRIYLCRSWLILAAVSHLTVQIIPIVIEPEYY
jgi:hypothetical protein